MIKLIITLCFLCFWNLTAANTEAPQTPYTIIPQKELDCMVKNSFFEANAEGKIGRLLVNQVVLNRADGINFCKEVYKPKQFSWTLKKKSNKIPNNVYKELEKEVLELYYGFIKVPKHLSSATHFHVTNINPYWRKQMKFLGTWKNHKFYQV